MRFLTRVMTLNVWAYFRQKLPELRLQFRWLGYRLFGYVSGRHGPAPHRLPGRLVVNLTSYPKRYACLPKTLKCLLTQNVAPDAVVLWVSEEDHPRLPVSCLRLQSAGLTIKRCPADYKSFNKIIHALRAEPDAFHVTADDDCYYEADWLKQLVDNYAPGEKAVVCRRVHRMFFGEDGHPGPYQRWHLMWPGEGVSPDFFLTGVGGVLYPPGALPKSGYMTDAFLALCPTADDVWLWWQVRLNGWSVRKTPGCYTPGNWAGTQAESLYLTNIWGGGNDTAIRAMFARYGLPSRVPAGEVPPPRQTQSQIGVKF